MVLQFFQTAHRSEAVRRSVTTLSPDDVKDYFMRGDGGWIVNQDGLNELSERTEPITWGLQRSIDRQPHSALYDAIEAHLSDERPVIVVVDAARLRDKGQGGDHAVVATGLNDRRVAVNDPWGYMHETFDREKFGKAWDPKANRIITTHISAEARIDGTVSEGGES